MQRVILNRIGASLFVLLGVSVLVFLMLHLTPGDPAALAAGQDATNQEIENLRRALGLDRSLPVQYFEFLTRALTGDFGLSFRTRQPVVTEIGYRYYNTMLLTGVSMSFAVVTGLLMGLAGTLLRRPWVSRLVEIIAILGVSVPSFFLGLLLMLIFAVWLGWLPLSGSVTLKGVILPALALGIGNAAIVSHVTQASIGDVFRQDFIRTAKAKGLKNRRIVLRHGLRNALMPVVTIVGLQAGYLLGGAVVVETVFGWPGLGRLIVQSIESRDFPVIQASVLLIAITFVVINLLTDILYCWINPKVAME